MHAFTVPYVGKRLVASHWYHVQIVQWPDCCDAMCRGTELNWVCHKDCYFCGSEFILILYLLFLWHTFSIWEPCPSRTVIRQWWYPVRKTEQHVSVPSRLESRLLVPSLYGICENKDADQLHDNREAHQRLCFRYWDYTISLLSKSRISVTWNHAYVLQWYRARKTEQHVRLP